MRPLAPEPTQLSTAAVAPTYKHVFQPSCRSPLAVRMWSRREPASSMKDLNSAGERPLRYSYAAEEECTTASIISSLPFGAAQGMLRSPDPLARSCASGGDIIDGAQQQLRRASCPHARITIGARVFTLALPRLLSGGGRCARHGKRCAGSG